MQVLDAAGRHMNATFSAEAEGDWVALIMESGGAAWPQR
jgi:hypothetical protein